MFLACRDCAGDAQILLDSVCCKEVVPCHWLLPRSVWGLETGNVHQPCVYSAFFRERLHHSFACISDSQQNARYSLSGCCNTWSERTVLHPCCNVYPAKCVFKGCSNAQLSLSALSLSLSVSLSLCLSLSDSRFGAMDGNAHAFSEAS